jgi:hypothetical protein
MMIIERLLSVSSNEVFRLRLNSMWEVLLKFRGMLLKFIITGICYTLISYLDFFFLLCRLTTKPTIHQAFKCAFALVH